jgi:hypothetical protein
MAKSEPWRAPSEASEERPRRPVFYLFRTGARTREPLARFTDRDEALIAAREAEGLGWRVAVRRCDDDPQRSRPPAWSDEYRSPRLARRGTNASTLV